MFLNNLNIACFGATTFFWGKKDNLRNRARYLTRSTLSHVLFFVVSFHPFLTSKYVAYLRFAIFALLKR